VAALLAAKGYHVIVPHLRGHGTTQFMNAATFRNGQQTASVITFRRKHRAPLLKQSLRRAAMQNNCSGNSRILYMTLAESQPAVQAISKPHKSCDLCGFSVFGRKR
jgi:hypothetical protein